MGRCRASKRAGTVAGFCAVFGWSGVVGARCQVLVSAVESVVRGPTKKVVCVWGLPPAERKSSTGLEPAISRFVGGCLIHWATRTHLHSWSPHHLQRSSVQTNTTSPLAPLPSFAHVSTAPFQPSLGSKQRRLAVTNAPHRKSMSTLPHANRDGRAPQHRSTTKHANTWPLHPSSHTDVRGWPSDWRKNADSWTT